MALRFYNTLSQQLEEFSPARDNTVRMYTCGPTVYDFAHIGNFRTFTFVDLLRKCLRANGFQLEPRHEHHGRGRQDHPQRRRAAQVARRVHRDLHEGLSGGLQDAAPGDARSAWRAPPTTSTTWWRPSNGSTPATTRIRSDGSIYFRIASFPGVRQALAQRFQRQSGRRAGGRGRVREGRRARFRALEGAERGRAGLGDADRRRAGPAGTSSAP